MSSETKPTIAFFGATGACANSTLALTLQDGYKCVALARTPSKLTKMLADTHSIPQSTIDELLTIVSGSIQDASAVKSVLSHNPSLIVSGIGGSPKLRANPLKPVTLDNPTICQNATQAILAAIRELKADGALTTFPALAMVSTTGISRVRDVPYLLMPLYHWLLAVPHEDKKVMERDVAAAAGGQDAVLAGFVSVRPTLLMDGPAKGNVRVGWEKEGDQSAPGPAIGYTVTRAEVGKWIFDNVVKGEGWKNWSGRFVTLTY